MGSNDAGPDANWRQIAREIEGRIRDGRLADGERLPTELVLAERFGVSRGTVHRAMADLKARGLLLRQRRNGTSVRTGVRARTGRVALIMDHAAHFPQVDLVRGIQAALPDGHGVLFFDVGEDPTREAEALERAAATTDGIVLYPSCAPENTPLLARLGAAGTPLVLVDRAPEGSGAPAVLTDNYAATLGAMRALVARGHRRVGFLSGDNGHVSSVAERHRAYCEALDEVGGYDPGLERWFDKGMEPKPDRLARAMEDALFAVLSRPDGERSGPPTAFFCVQDLYAAAATEALAALGVDSPRPEILTFNDWPPMVLRDWGTFHRIVQRPFEIGRVAAARLMELCDGAPVSPDRIEIRAEHHAPEAPRTRTLSPLAHARIAAARSRPETVTQP